jgi:hypothetical protein
MPYRERLFEESTVQCATASMMCVNAADMLEKAKAMSERAAKTGARHRGTSRDGDAKPPQRSSTTLAIAFVNSAGSTGFGTCML